MSTAFAAVAHLSPSTLAAGLAHGVAVKRAAEPIGWSVQRGPLFGLIVAGVGYALLVLAVVRRGQRVSGVRVVAFCAGLATVAVALFSPLDPYGEEHSFAAHMVQHELLLMVAPLLLIAGVDQRITIPLTRRIFGPALRVRPWRAVLAAVGNPFVVTTAWCAVVLGWHLPALYDLALDNDTVHIVEHASLLSVGIAFWVVVIGRLPSVHHTTTAQRIGAIGCAMAASSILAAVFLWSPGLLYSGYARAHPWFGLTPLQDQRFAAVLMMAIDMPLLLGAALFVTARWSRRESRLGPSRRAGTTGGSIPPASHYPTPEGLLADG
jgi:putative membrane protein